jgi:hypothetical protein
MNKKLLLLIFAFVSCFGFSQVTFTGGYLGDWETASNWSNNEVPSSTDNVSIQDKYVTINSDVVVNNITLLNNGLPTFLVIEKNASLTVNGDVQINNGDLYIYSDSNEYGSIITNGNVSSTTGNTTYYRWVNGVNGGSSGWDLIGSPINSISVSVLAGDPDMATNGSTYALGYMGNNTNPVSWTNYTTSDNSTTLTNAKGYQMATTGSGATLQFVGDLNRTNQTIAITNNNPTDTGNSGLSGSRWNLVANPFPSYINANSNAGTNNFFSVNSSLFHASWGAIYGFDGSGGHVVINNTSNATYLAPGQGFFMASVAAGGTVSFNTNMRTVSGTDDFISGRLSNTSKEFYLRLYEDNNSVDYNKFYFDNGLSLGLDPGYDAGAFDQNMSISSRLVEEDEGINFIFNAMGLNALDEETVIPLVLNRDAGVEFSISFEDSTIPEDVGVYLEDTLLETLTDLRSENFTLTPESDLSDMGRFYLRIGNTSLGGNDLDESYISIYKAASDDFVTIEGTIKC